MEKFPLRLIPLFALLASCSIGKAGLGTTLGNYAFQKGDYQKAMVHYLEALEDRNFADLLYYNLGNLYFSLGEPETAKEAWDLVEPGTDTELLYRIFFNTGLYYYEKGLYPEAYHAYRKALILRPQDTDAKINLELSYRKILLKDRSGDKSVSDQKDIGRNSLRVLQYVQRKEELFWSERNRSPKETESGKGW